MSVYLEQLGWSGDIRDVELYGSGEKVVECLGPHLQPLSLQQAWQQVTHCRKKERGERNQSQERRTHTYILNTVILQSVQILRVRMHYIHSL